MFGQFIFNVKGVRFALKYFHFDRELPFRSTNCVDPTLFANVTFFYGTPGINEILFSNLFVVNISNTMR